MVEHGKENDPTPGYLYRDYGYMIWDALTNYVKGLIDEVYANDEAVARDVAVQRWCQEVGNPAFGNVGGFPSRITRRDDLTFVLTNVIFTASAQHSAVNFGQFDFYGFIPNKPLRMMLPMPKVGLLNVVLLRCFSLTSWRFCRIRTITSHGSTS